MRIAEALEAYGPHGRVRPDYKTTLPHFRRPCKSPVFRDRSVNALLVPPVQSGDHKDISLKARLLYQK